MQDYKTITQPHHEQIEIEKSLFICFLLPCLNEQEAKQSLREIKKQHPKATHHCYAYVFNHGTIYKSSDDHEPSGTAGLPILDVLINENYNNIIAIVVRYFGGTLLGKGGLVRAYTSAVKAALQSAEILLVQERPSYLIKVEYSLYDSLSYYLKQEDAIILDRKFLEQVEIKLLFIKAFDINSIMSYTQGKAIITPLGMYSYESKIKTSSF